MTDKKKLYYSNWLIAAYMAETHGVQIDGLDYSTGIEIISDDDGNETSRTRVARLRYPWNNGDGKFYTNPDYDDVFKPEVEDMDGACARVVPDGENSFNNQITISYALELYALGKFKIEKRDGKLFFWPESEELKQQVDSGMESEAVK